MAALAAVFSGDTTVHKPKEVFSKCKAANWEVAPNEYKVKSKIGEGAFGLIYKATLRGKMCAAKMLKQDSDIAKQQGYKDLVMELDILVSVGKHENLVEFMGACIVDDNYPIIFEEYMGGPSLSEYFGQLMNNTGHAHRPGRAISFKWIVDMFRALEFLHNRDPIIIHRDLKPANLLLTKDLTRLKLADFGMSKMVSRSTIHFANHKGHTGTLAYMAPEVFNRETSHYTEKVDIYSAAILTWTICTGNGPMLSKLAATTPHNVLMRPQLSQIEWPELEAVVEAAWAQDPNMRPSATDTLVALLRIPERPGLLLTPQDFSSPGCACSVQ